MTQYAKGTTVRPEATRDEIERTLNRYGADQFVYGWDDERQMAIIGFRLKGMQIRLVLKLPAADEQRFRYTPDRRLRRNDVATRQAWEAAKRQAWRELLLIIKAKLVAVEAGVVEFATEFLPYIVLPGGQTVGEHLEPQLPTVLATGEVPSLLPLPGGTHGHT